MCVNGSGDQGSISGQVIPKTHLMPPCLTLSIIKYGLRVSWAIQVKKLRPSQHLDVVAIEKEAFGLTTGGQLLTIHNTHTNDIKKKEHTNESQLLEIYTYCSMNKQYIDRYKNRKKKPYLDSESKIVTWLYHSQAGSKSRLFCSKNSGKRGWEWVSENVKRHPTYLLIL